LDSEGYAGSTINLHAIVDFSNVLHILWYQREVGANNLRFVHPMVFINNNCVPGAVITTI